MPRLVKCCSTVPSSLLVVLAARFPCGCANRPTGRASTLVLQAGYWREYADQQMSCAGEAVVKSVFSRCLLTCLSVDLWRSYLNFIKRVGPGDRAQRSTQGHLLSEGEIRARAGWLWLRQCCYAVLDHVGARDACDGTAPLPEAAPAGVHRCCS